MDERDTFKINWDYLPIKAHYLFMYAGMGGTLPYMQVIAKDFGITPTAVGIIYTLVPLCVCLSKPLFGFITDKLRNMKAILIMLLTVTALSYFAVLYVPSITGNRTRNIEVAAVCQDPGNELLVHPSKYDTACANDLAGRTFECELTSRDCLRNKTFSGMLNVTEVLSDKTSTSHEFLFKLHRKYIHTPECECLRQNNSSLTCEHDFYKCNPFSTRSSSEYSSYNFWVFALLSVISGTGTATIFSLSDTACYEVLGSNTRLYGKQRLWGTISWGITTFASGALNDLATGDSEDTNYFPGFYLMLAFISVDIILLCNLRLEKTNVSLNICKDVGKIFSSIRTVVFAFGVYIGGALAGLLWTYQFWYLTELGSSQLLLGLVAAVQCLVAEVPFFFFSGWFVKKFGHFFCLIAALAAYALRLGLYTLLQNPWLVLPIEVLHGITYAIFCASMSLYAVDYAPPGTEATMVGIFGGIFEGLGVATGSFLGGLGFDNMGSRWTFFVASMISLCCVPVFTILHKIIPKSDGTMDLDWDYSGEIHNYGSHDPR